MNLKQKTISGLFWSFSDNFLNKTIHFVFGIILARLIEPKEFGLIGMLIFFNAISQILINSGLSQALIRKKDCSNEDFSTVFYFNIIVSIFFYILLFLSAGSISDFYNEPKLKLILWILAIEIVISSFGMVQATILTKDINFRLQTKISIISSISSGIIGVYFAFYGWHVWSLVFKTLSQSLINTTLLWVFNRWRPLAKFSIISLKTLFPFSINIMLTGLITTFYRNVYYLVIGKFFSSSELGFFTRAEQFRNLPSQNINHVIQRVSFPVLSKLQDDDQQLKKNFRRLIKNTIYITSILLIGMAAISEKMVPLLIGKNWMPVVPYLQLLCIVGIFHPIHSLNFSILLSKGRSDIYLKLETLFLLLTIPVILIGIYYGIIQMIWGLIFHSAICWLINSKVSGKLIGYSMKEQLRDIFPSITLAALMGIIATVTSSLISLHIFIELAIQITTAVLSIFFLSAIFKNPAFMDLKVIIMNLFKTN